MPQYFRTLLPAVAIVAIIAGCKKNNGVPATLSVTPTEDTTNGIITITGSGFSTIPKDNLVLFNDSVVGTVLTATGTQLTVQVPAFDTRNRILVKTPDGKVQQTEQEFEIVPKFFPQAEAPGYPITIATGGAANSIPSDYSVSFNCAGFTPTKNREGLLTVTVPSGAINGPITVTYQGQPFTSLTNFTVTPLGTVSTLAKGGFSSPAGLAFDKNGNLFVSDLQGGVVDEVNPTTGSVTLYAGNGSYSTGGGPSTAGLCIDASGNLFVTDRLQIKEVATDGTITVLAGQGTQGYVNGPAASALFYSLSSLAQDPMTGDLYIADNTVLRKLSNGTVTTVAGGGGNGAYQDGTSVNAGFVMINSIVRDPGTGNIYVTDPSAHVIRMVSPAGVVTTIAGNPGQQGSANGTGAAALFEGPGGITLDKSGNLYVTDGNYSNSTIRKIVVN